MKFIYSQDDGTSDMDMDCENPIDCIKDGGNSIVLNDDVSDDCDSDDDRNIIDDDGDDYGDDGDDYGDGDGDNDNDSRGDDNDNKDNNNDDTDDYNDGGGDDDDDSEDDYDGNSKQSYQLIIGFDVMKRVLNVCSWDDCPVLITDRHFHTESTPKNSQQLPKTSRFPVLSRI